ncbi:hypothetical protein NQ318_018873 [Aromia moschata]|uniref:CHK kinase-like domain-containing protein n=1 Tax=Aromia moschata TaxID=1265417 RepID=A0AAV8ZGC7_9CUCU|nr:hypothetical protein NQ318_018873 [Aromia moschata]
MSFTVSGKVVDLLKTFLNINLENYTINIHDPTKKGEGFLGEVFFVSVKDKVNGKVLSFVVKQAFQNEKVRNLQPIREYYLNEIYFYKKVWPALDELQRKVPLGNNFDKIPHCFGTSSTDGEEILILENLKDQGFQIHEKKVPLDKQHFKFIFIQYGRFHGLSFAYKLLHPQDYNELAERLTLDFRVLNRQESFRRYVAYILETALKCLYPENNAKVLEKFQPYLENAAVMFYNSFDYKGNYSVILHGDCWSNNMMFKYDENKELTDMMLLDFQYLNIGTPVYDLSYCLYSAGTKEIFDDLDWYLKIYHDSFLKTVGEFGLNTKAAYPFEELRKDWSQYCKMGFIMALMIWRIKLTDEDDAADFTDIEDESIPETFFSSSFDEEAYKMRTRDLICHIISPATVLAISVLKFYPTKMSVVVPEKIYNLLKSVVDRSLENYSIYVLDPNKKGEGFLGEMCYVSLEDKVSGKVLNFVVKQAFENEKVRERHHIKEYYLNEIYFYTKVWPAFIEVQKEVGLPDAFDKIPKCYCTSSKNGQETLVLKNLKIEGFSIYDKKKPLDKEHFELIFRQYGRFHALSFAYKMLHPLEYDELSKGLTVSFRILTKQTGFITYVERVFNNALESLDPENDAKVLEKSKRYVGNVLEIFDDSCNYKGKYSVILHGDCWSNNMMFKYDECNKLIDLRLLDFQFSNVGTPVNDLSYCLYSGGTKEIFDDLDHYLKLYHESLMKTIKEFGLGSENVFSFEELKKDWKEYCKMGLVMGLMAWLVKTTYESNIMDLTDIKDTDDDVPKERNKNTFDEVTFKRRSRDIFVHLFENDFVRCLVTIRAPLSLNYCNKMSNVISQTTYDLLQTVVKGSLEDYSIKVHDKNKKGEGFLGDMCYVSLEDRKRCQRYDVVVKQAFKDEGVRNMHPIRKYFLNEIYFYTSVWPELDKFQKSFQLSNPFDNVAKCYTTVSEDTNECLVLENLRFQDFQMYDKTQPLNKEHYEFIFKQYGSFHAISFAYKFLKPEEFSKLSRGFVNDFSVIAELKIMCNFISFLFDISMKCLDPESEAEVLEKCRPYLENGPEMFKKSCRYDGDYSAIVHGDCWSNNMMFRYNKSQRLEDIRLLDFQFSNVGTPVWDLSYCLYSGASKDILDNLDYYLKLYHGRFSKTIEEFGLNSEDVYPFEQLKKDWRRCCKMGFMMGLMVWRGKLTHEKDIIDFTDLGDASDDSNLEEKAFGAAVDEEAFRLRCRDLIFHMYDNDFL